jgi:heme exporter protein A
MVAAASPVPPLLQATSLERRFGALRALRGVSLSVYPGECHLVVGPNGAGKSTLLRLLAGLARPSAGSIALDGEALTSEPALRRSIGLLSHQSHLYDDLSALENLAFAARLHRLPGDPTGTARRRLAAVGLTERLDEPIRRLSRGTVQRLAIARALLHGPRLLLLDEPFSGLDPSAADRVAVVLNDERRAGKGLVLVSHDVHESWELATHLHVLVQGAWTIDEPKGGTLEEFLHRYREALHG